jgi:hypothetical protein
MSDIDNHSYGRGASPWGDIRTGLTEVERRLGELQDQLDPRQPATGITGSVRSAIDVARDTIGGAVDPIAAELAPPMEGLLEPVATGFIPSPFDIDPAVRRSAEEILAQARLTARDTLAAAEEQVSLVKGQIEQLLLARETLRRSLRSLLADCENSLQRFEHGDPSTQGSGGDPMSGDHWSSLTQLGSRPLTQSPTLPGAIGIEATTKRFVSSLPPAPETPEVFDGSVSLRVGPLRDISQVDTLEIALLQVPGAERVDVKEFAGRDAVAVIKLFQPVPLVEELRRVLPFQFEVASVCAEELTLIAVEDGETGRSGDSASALPQVGAE